VIVPVSELVKLRGKDCRFKAIVQVIRLCFICHKSNGPRSRTSGFATTKNNTKDVVVVLVRFTVFSKPCSLYSVLNPFTVFSLLCSESLYSVLFTVF
jgi:hypothetical protein